MDFVESPGPIKQISLCWVYCSYDGNDAHVPANEGDSVLLASTNADNVYKKMRWRGEYIVKFWLGVMYEEP